MERAFPNGRKLRIVIGDITKIPVDAIVNAANSALAGGGGVDGAIHRAGGPSIMQQLRAYDRCATGSAVVTGAGQLPARHIFHAVGPVFRDGNHGEPQQLASCYETCLKLAIEHKVETISFPAISTGIYGYPLDQAARIAIKIVTRHLETVQPGVREAIFVLFDHPAHEVYRHLLLE
jgi:O-acetyl-ADP-ribose deacetylase (regulator of RNase III)